jgi:hypothetical protein
MKKTLIFSFSLLALLVSPAFSQETLTITTYYPSPTGIYNRLATTTLGVGDNDGSGTLDAADAPDPATNPGDVWIAGDVGIGTITPQLPAPNGNPGNLDVNDVYLRSTGEWLSQAGGGGGCYVSYSGGCLTGFTNMGSLGSFGNCYHQRPWGGSDYFSPPGGTCSGSEYRYTFGTADVCCQ